MASLRKFQKTKTRIKKKITFTFILTHNKYRQNYSIFFSFGPSVNIYEYIIDVEQQCNYTMKSISPDCKMKCYFK